MNLIVNLTAAVALASTIPTTPVLANDAPPVGGVATERPASDETRELVEKVRKHYRALKTYSDTITVSQVIELPEGVEDTTGMVDMMSGSDQKITFAYQSDQGFVIRSQGMEVGSADGGSITMAMTDMGQYRELPVKGGDMVTALKGDMFGQMTMQQHPVFGLIFGLSEPGTVVGALGDATKVSHEDMQGRAMLILTSAMKMPADQAAMLGADAIPLEITIDEESLSMYSVELDVTAMMKKSMEMMAGGQGAELPEFKSVRVVMKLDDVHMNEPLAADSLAIDTAGLEKVDAFEFGGAGGAMEPALAAGEEAPDFTAPNLEEGDFTLSDLRGKVVVLDFWATWCGPCVAAIPSVQKLSEEFASSGVVVIGVNQDRAGMEDKIRAFLANKNVTFHQVLDAKGEVGKSYRVTGIPTTVVIDAAGVIRSYEVGFHGEDALRAAIVEAIEAGVSGG